MINKQNSWNSLVIDTYFLYLAWNVCMLMVNICILWPPIVPRPNLRHLATSSRALWAGHVIHRRVVWQDHCEQGPPVLHLPQGVPDGPGARRAQEDLLWDIVCANMLYSFFHSWHYVLLYSIVVQIWKLSKYRQNITIFLKLLSNLVSNMFYINKKILSKFEYQMRAYVHLHLKKWGQWHKG
jgi:hypothetical protein